MIQDLILLETNLRYSNRRKTIIVLSTSLVIDNITARGYRLNVCDRLWENRPLRAHYDFSVEAFVVYLT